MLKKDLIHSTKFSDDIPNPFERWAFAFRVLSEEKYPMSRTKKYSFIILGVPQINSIQRIFCTLHDIRLIRIHSLLRFVVETIFIALSSIYHTLLLELIIITVFALLSIALEGDTPFSNSNIYEPYENYTEALYSYYMCITLEGVNEVAEHILQLDSPQFTTVIGLIFLYICCYSYI